MITILTYKSCLNLLYIAGESSVLDKFMFILNSRLLVLVNHPLLSLVCNKIKSHRAYLILLQANHLIRNHMGKARYVVPAKACTTNEIIENRKQFNSSRYCVVDYCDFCLPDIKEIYIRKTMLSLRKRGYKFICWDCYYDYERLVITMKGQKLICGQTKKTLI